MSTILHKVKALGSILFFLCTLSYITGCGKLGSIEEETRPYLDVFKGLAAARGLDLDYDELSISFADLKDNIAGTCYSNGHIDIDPEIWKRYGDDEREVLIFHELGHCLLNRGHTSGNFSDNAPVSIMNPTIMYPVFYRRRKDYYRSELFDNARLIVGLRHAITNHNEHTDCH